MFSQSINTSRISGKLGLQLFTARLQNNVAEVKRLTSSIDSQNWASAILAAASESSSDVIAYCMDNTDSRDATTDDILWLVLADESLYPAYYYLLDSGVVDCRHSIDRTGQLLGVAAGAKERRRYGLAENLLRRGADPNQTVSMYGSKAILTAAAGHSDSKMVELLLDHGAHINGNAALAYATEMGRTENVQNLIARGADVNDMVPLISFSQPHRESMGTALHKAVEFDHAYLIDTLLSAGSDLTLKDGKGRTAYDIAEEKGVDSAILAKLSYRH